MDDLKIENVIASIEFGDELSLQAIADSVKNAEYNPDQFPGLIYKLKSPKSVILMFAKGYCVCTGATSLQNAKAALTIIYKKLDDLKILNMDNMPKIIVQNIIVSYKFKNQLNLADLAKSIPVGEIEYNPQKFPGLILYDKNTGISVLMFKSGVIIGYDSPYLMEIQNLLTELEQFYS